MHRNHSKDPLPPIPPESIPRLSEAVPRLVKDLGGFGAPRRAESVILLLVDGLGAQQLDEYKANTPFLNRALRDPHPETSTWATVHPSTTASALTSLGTGLPPGQHGVVGYDVYDPDRDTVINQLGNWDLRTVPEQWQPHPIIWATLPAPLQAFTVSMAEFETSALTRAALGGAEFVAGKTLSSRFHKAAQVAETSNRFIYLYANELDKAGHAQGPGSGPWLEVLEAIDSEVARLVRKLQAQRDAGGSDVKLVLTADHGMVYIAPEHRIDFSQFSELVDGVAHTAGEPRLVHLHFDPTATAKQRENTLNAWRHHYAEQAWIATRDEAISQGWFGETSPTVAARIGDLLIATREAIALYDGRRANPMSFSMQGHHGSLTEAETLIPWLVFDGV